MNIKNKVKKLLKYFGIVLLVLLVAEVFALLVLRSQVSRYAEFWSEQNSVKVDGALTYVALGDSTAQAIGATSPMRGYVGLFAKSLDKQTEKSVNIINLSKSGAKLSDALNEQLPRLTTLQPDIVTIEIGANDILEFNPERFEQEFSEVLAGLPSGTLVSDMPYFGGTQKASYEDRVLQANRIIHKLVPRYDVKLVSLHQITKDRASWRNIAVDAFHPSNRGYQNWHDAFWAAHTK